MYLFSESREIIKWKTYISTYLVEGDSELWDTTSSVSLVNPGENDLTTTPTRKNFN